MKKLAVSLLAVLTAALMTACGGSFDASGYVNALLDNSYKNDSTSFVEMKIGTAEEASKLYEEGLDTEMDAMLAGIEMSDEQIAEYREVIADILAAAKYTVGEAEKQDDGSYVVTVTYETMNIFAAAMVDYEQKITDMVSEWTQAAMAGEEYPSEDEMMTLMIDELKPCLEDALANATYSEPATTTITVELVDKVYTPNENDIMELETLLFDVDAMSGM